MPTPNHVKYNTSLQSNSIKKNKFNFGVDAKEYGPTANTDFWNGVTPPANGYTIYAYKASGGPSIVCPENDTELITWTRRLGGTNISTVYDALAWYNTQNDFVCCNIDYPSTATSNLKVLLDSGWTPCYPRSGSTWYDVSGGAYNATLQNEPTFSTNNKGILEFSSTSNSHATIGSIGSLSTFTVECWFYLTSLPSGIPDYPALVTDSENSNNINFAIGWLNNNGNLYGGYKSTTWNIAGGYTPSTNTWTNVAVTFDGSDIKFYVNGSLNDTQNAAGSPTQSGIGLNIAKRWDTPTCIDGYLPIVRIYNTALTATQISQNYNSTSPRF